MVKRKSRGYAPVQARSFLGKRRRVVRGGQGFQRVGGYYGRYAPTLRGRMAHSLGELKFFDTIRAQQSSATAGVIHNSSLVLIPQGVTESTRVGRKCTLKKLSLKGQISMGSITTIGDTENQVRFIIYLDKQCNGATAAVTDILESASVNSFRNLANSGRFQVLKDFKHVLMPRSCFAGASVPTVVKISCNLNLNLPIEYSSTTGALTEIRSNNIGILSVCDSALGLPSVAYTVRARFGDQ